MLKAFLVFYFYYFRSRTIPWFWLSTKNLLCNLTDSAIEQLIHSFVTSRLDYCNSLLNEMPGYKLKHIPRMQNIAAIAVSRCNYRDHITPVLISVHWLPVKCHIVFKLLLLTYKCLNWCVPRYLSCLVMSRKHSYEPRPQNQGQLQVPEV